MKKKDWFAFIGLSLAWGTSFLWIKIAVGEIGPFTLVALRLIFGILGLLVVVFIRKPEWLTERRQWIALAVIGVTNVAIPFTLISWGQQHIDSAIASILNGTVPLFTVIFAHFFLADDRLNMKKGIGVIVGFVGVVFFVLIDLQAGVQSNFLGSGAVLLAAILYAFSAVYIRRNGKGISNIVQSLMPLVVAAVLLWITTPFVEAPIKMPILPITWFAIVWLGLIGSCIGYLLLFYLLHSVGPSRTTMVAFTFPVIGLILGVSFLGESLTWNLVAGCILVIASIAIVNHRNS